jgi:Domain of unknown function (DUF362)
MAITRRKLLIGGGAVGTIGAAAFVFRSRVRRLISRATRDKDFTATPALLPHRPDEARTIYSASGAPPAANVDAIFDKIGIEKIVGEDDVVIIKVAAQWWNQGMTNVAAARRVIERVLARPNFRGEVVVFENTHFRLADGSGLSRAFTRPSERNVDVDGWSTLGDLVAHYKPQNLPVSFVGLVDAATSELAGDPWHDPAHTHGVYGGDGRGPIATGELRDGYHWDFTRTFAKKRSWVDTARTPLTWPVFSSPRSKLRIDLADGVFEGPTKTSRKLTWISLVNVNQHGSTGMTACCKSAMGVVDMSAGRFGTDPRSDGYQSVHYFGNPDASWRMAGPLAQFAREVRTPDLYLAVAEWVALEPPPNVAWDGDRQDIRLEGSTAHRANTIVAGTDAVAVDWWAAKHVLAPIAQRTNSRGFSQLDLANPDSKLSRFLRYYREVYRGGTMDDALITVA